MAAGLFKPKVMFPRWGALSTLAWYFVIASAVLFIQQLILGMYVGVFHKDYLVKLNGGYPVVNIGRLQKDFQFDGVVFSFSTIISFLVTAVLLFSIIRLKKGARFVDYFAIRVPSFQSIQIWVFVLCIVLFLANIYALMIGKPVPPDFLRELIETANPRWLMFLSLVILGPLFHEFLFRGFLLSGLENSELPPVSSVILISLIWAGLHYALDFYVVVITFAIGMVFGLSRIHSGSIFLPLGLHILMNSATLLIILNNQH